MFDIGFSELIVIGVVALVVIGPERLPKVARTAGHLFGRLQRYVSSVKSDIAREMELDELRKFKSEMETTARSVEASVQQEVSLAEQEVRALQKEAEQSLQPGASSAAAGDLSGVGPDKSGEPVPPADSKPAPQMELALDVDRGPKSTGS
jgi:sec-independent protein translocase protein TatB